MLIRFGRKRQCTLPVKCGMMHYRNRKYLGAGENTLHITKKRG